MPAPRLLFVGHDASRTGAPHSLLKIVRWIAGQGGPRPLVLLGEGGPLVPAYAEAADTLLWHAPGQRAEGWAARLHRRRTLARVAAFAPAAVFHNTGVQGDLLALLARRLQVPVVARIAELEAYMQRNAATGSVQQVLASAQHLVAVSQAVRHNLVQRHGVPAERISVVHGACDVEPIAAPAGDWRRRWGIAPEEPMVCGCGTMDWRKGFDLFLQVAHRLRQQGREDVRFVWIGAPLTPAAGIEWRCELQALGLERQLLLPGPMAHPSEAFAEADAFFLSSREDPFPLVMLEAARQSLPLVCFRGSGGAAEFVTRDLGVAVPMLDTEAAARALLEVLQRENGARLGAAAREQSLLFNADRMGREILDVIERTIAAHAHRCLPPAAVPPDPRKR